MLFGRKSVLRWHLFTVEWGTSLAANHVRRSVITKLPKPAYTVSWEATGTSTCVRDVLRRGGIADNSDPKYWNELSWEEMQKDAERHCLKVGFYRSQVTSLLWASQGYVKRQRDILCSVKKVAVKEWPYFLIWRKSLQAHSSPIPFILSASASPTLGPGVCI